MSAKTAVAEQWTSYDPAIDKVISFRPVTLDEDLTMLHNWMHQAHVIPFWKLNVPLDQYRKHLENYLAKPHQRLHIGCLDGMPMSYWETYWVKDDILGNYYPVHEADQGVHLLIGPPVFLGKGYAQPMLQAITSWLFQHAETEKVVAEPDIRNHKMIHIFQKCGYQLQKEIQLPEKRAALLFCRRASFIEGGSTNV